MLAKIKVRAVGLALNDAIPCNVIRLIRLHHWVPKSLNYLMFAIMTSPYHVWRKTDEPILSKVGVNEF